MDANYIAYETLVANRNAAEWAFWSMIAAFISGTASVVTLIFAYRALTTWREQEKTKVKMEFRFAIKQLRVALLNMPLDLDRDELEEEREQVIVRWLFKDVDLISQQIDAGEQNVQRFDNLLSIFDACQSSWLATEHLFDGTQLARDWIIFEDDFEHYINGEGTKAPLVQLLNKITSSRFVFDSK
ncbi:hypothetical protein [Klebsiella oxytoca]|uniref:hypothetical protein n=1 Tax=Klebsiella oxytoca TaxID=571 RepID=UPI003879D172